MYIRRMFNLDIHLDLIYSTMYINISILLRYINIILRLKYFILCNLLYEVRNYYEIWVRKLLKTSKLVDSNKFERW